MKLENKIKKNFKIYRVWISPEFWKKEFTLCGFAKLAY